MSTSVVLIPDAGPLITLAYADALDLLRKPGWSIALVDMVLHELTRHQTPTSQKIAQWVDTIGAPVRTTRTFQYHQRALLAEPGAVRKSNLGELAIQETMNEFALDKPEETGVFLFEDHKIARPSFLLPDNCRKVSTRGFLVFLEQKGWLVSAAEIERRAIQAGRNFSKLRFPHE